MFNFDNFDIHQISPKLAQRWHFVCSFCCKKNFTLGSLDKAKNAKRQFFFGHLISNSKSLKQDNVSCELAVKIPMDHKRKMIRSNLTGPRYE